MRTLIAGVGMPDLDDPPLSKRLRESLAHDAPISAARVVIEDLSSDPVEAARRLDSEWPRFERVILVGEVARERPPGTIAAYRWDGESGSESSHDGVAHFDSTLLALRELADVPDELVVVEVEPEVRHAGSTTASNASFTRARSLLRRLATSSQAVADLPLTSLGGTP